jgi:hypothetical protein
MASRSVMMIRSASVNRIGSGPLSVRVAVTAGQNLKLAVSGHDSVDEPVFLVDTTGRPAGQVALQEFGLADSSFVAAQNIPDEGVDTMIGSR